MSSSGTGAELGFVVWLADPFGFLQNQWETNQSCSLKAKTPAHPAGHPNGEARQNGIWDMPTLFLLCVRIAPPVLDAAGTNQAKCILMRITKFQIG
jgi:hypothetical protein